MKSKFAPVSVLLMLAMAALPVMAQEEAKMTEEFMKAATQGDVAKVKEMLKADAALARAKDQKGVSVILKATYYGKQDVVAVLLDSGIELNIFEAAATGQTARVRTLVKQNASLANAFTPDGFMPLGLAVFFGHPETVAALLAEGADVNAITKEAMKVTPLASAAAARQIGIARMLIARGANVNAQAENNLTPLHEAAANGDIELATLLLEHGANINCQTRDGRTPLAFAFERNRTEMAEFLGKRGAVR